MNNLKSTWIVSILLIVILFLFTVYPSTEAFVNVPDLFQDVFRILLFVAILSLMVFLLTETNNWYKRCQMLSQGSDQFRKDKESSVNAIGLHYKIDTSENYQQLVHHLTGIIHASLMAQSVFIYLFNGEENCYILQDSSSSHKTQPLKSFSCEGELFNNFHLNPKSDLFQSGQISQDYLKYYHNPPKIGTLMLVPINVNGSYVGFIGTDSIDKETWGKEDLDLLTSFSHLFSNAVLQIDVVDQQEVYISFFRDLFRLNTEITFGIEPHELYKQAAGILKKFFSFDKLTFAFKNKEHASALTIEYVEGSEADYTIGHEISLKKGVWEPIILQNKPILIKDYDKSQVEFRFQPDDLKIIPFRSALGIPVSSAAREAGGILIESFKIDHYTKEDVETLSLFGKNFAEILNRLTVYQSMKDLAMVDGLTGIYNHRAFKERLQIEIERSRRYNSNLTLIILDLDKFKRINDTYGHLHGDYVLKKSANIIRGSVRTVDTVARYGGEEFAVILISADKKSCMNTAERICKNIHSFLFEKDGMTERMSISIGMSEYPGDGDDIASLISSADMAMYRAKRAGGNQVVMYEHES
ncbi:MAG: diguanylate cyclase [Candidatus Marinimicrobia bacterium]|nr:diguanylate cyclase [Candidatus Neomarinimicrobiota bacterium]